LNEDEAASDTPSADLSGRVDDCVLLADPQWRALEVDEAAFIL
jgi:hypothetical protein